MKHMDGMIVAELVRRRLINLDGRQIRTGCQPVTATDLTTAQRLHEVELRLRNATLTEPVDTDLLIDAAAHILAWIMVSDARDQVRVKVGEAL